MERRRGAEEVVGRLTGEVRHLLEPTENEPVGVLTAYRDSLLRLADALDHLAAEVDARHESG